MNRRGFLTKSALLGSGIALTGMHNSSVFKKSLSGDKMILGVMGLGGRNLFLIEEFIKQGAEIA